METKKMSRDIRIRLSTDFTGHLLNFFRTQSAGGVRPKTQKALYFTPWSSAR